MSIGFRAASPRAGSAVETWFPAELLVGVVRSSVAMISCIRRNTESVPIFVESLKGSHPLRNNPSVGLLGEPRAARHPRRAANVEDFGDLGARRAGPARRDGPSARRTAPPARRPHHVGAPNANCGAPRSLIAIQFPKFTPEVPQELPQKETGFPNITLQGPQILPPRSPYPHRQVVLSPCRANASGAANSSIVQVSTFNSLKAPPVSSAATNCELTDSQYRTKMRGA